MELRTLASGSSGNCLLFTTEGGGVLVDCGISCRRITTSLRELEVDPGSLSGVLITHEHSDHIAGLAVLSRKYALPIYTSPGTARQLCCRTAGLEELIRPVEPGEPFQVGPFACTGFPTSHDAAQPMGFTLSDGEARAAVATDLGYVTGDVLDAVLGARLVVCESNHDVDWLLSGPYPYPLRARILGDMGHLCNEAGADLARRCAEAGARTVILAHLSQENNTPARALAVAETALRSAGWEPGRDLVLAVAPRDRVSPPYEV